MLEAFYNLVDAPIPPLKEFADYLKGAYGEGNARLMAQSESNALRAIIDAGGDVSRSRAGEISCPSLLITGEHDFLATPSLVSEMAGAIPGGEFVEAKDASHPIHHERPEFLTQTIAEWLGKQ
jgi:pimeloyl-ACP methyl ester carboxylesterase